MNNLTCTGVSTSTIYALLSQVIALIQCNTIPALRTRTYISVQIQKPINSSFPRYLCTISKCEI